jgi:predicted chitinase
MPWIPMLFCGISNATSTPGGTGFASIVSEAQFNQMFPSRNAFYTYQGLVTAASFYPAFAGTGDIEVRKREAAAALANFAHETGGLWYITEIAQGLYCDATNTQYPCAPGQRYYGRGPIQLSWNFNYGAAGDALGLPLLANPSLVEQDPAVAWKTALWYWMTQTGPGTMTAHNAIVSGAGFGETIRSINGALECNGGNSAQVQSRINYFLNFLNILGGTAGPGRLDC